jgi:hypothetical protein
MAGADPGTAVGYAPTRRIDALPPPRSLYIHGNLDVIVDALAYPPPPRAASLLLSPSNSRLNPPLWGVV